MKFEIDKHLSSSIKGENIVDSLSITQKVRTLISLLQDDITSEYKIKIAEFLCGKLYNVFFLSPNFKEIIISELSKVLMTDSTLNPPVRLFYLRFREEIVPYTISCRIYHDGVRDIVPNVPYFQILKYIMRSYLVNNEIRDEILNELEELFVDENVSNFVKMDIADTFILNHRERRGHEMLDTLRMVQIEDNFAVADRRFSNMSSIYDDNQNVHTSDINDSVLSVCVKLISSESSPGYVTDDVQEDLITLFPDKASAIQTVLERVDIDTSRFRLKDDAFSLYDVFSALWSYISRHPSKDDLKARLIEEFEDMEDYCTTGHLSRFVNVIQGYTNDDDLNIKISDREQIKSVLIHYMNTVLEAAPDNVTDAMLGSDKSVFYEYLQTMLNERIPGIITEYGDVEEHIIFTVKFYSGWDFWKIENGCIFLVTEN